MNKGIITKINKDLYTVSFNNSVYDCRQTGLLYRNKIKPVVGDYVIFNNSTLRIEELLPRKNSLIRPLVANIDKLIIVVSTSIPAFSSYLLDKFIVIAESNNIKPIIVFTKEDQLSIKERLNILKYKIYYKHLGYKVFSSTQTNKIKKEFNDSTIALTGQTGAGKSTLLNKISKDLNLKTNEVSMSLGRGKHTTRVVELFSLYGGLVADTPGFSSLELDIKPFLIKDYYKEFNHYKCKYGSCMHIKESYCEVKNNIEKSNIFKERYENYVKLVSEVNKK